MQEQIAALAAILREMPLAEKVEAINAIKLMLHAESPHAAEPVDCVIWVHADAITANDYNPNAVAPPG